MARFRHILQRLARFRRAQGGGFAVWTAASLIPIAVLAGAATDYHRLTNMRSALQGAADTAALAAGRAYLAGAEGDPARLAAARAAAGEALAANLGPQLSLLQDLRWDVQPGTSADGELVFTANARIPMAFSGLLGLADVPVSTSAATQVGLRLEVALVLDTTGSMLSGNKLPLMKAATARLIDQLNAAAAQNPRRDPLKLALVPYSNTVRLPASYARATWMDGQARGDGYWNRALRPDPLFDRFDAYGEAGWAGCIESRPMPLDVSDAPARAADPDSLYVPFWNPDTPGEPNAGCSISPLVRLTTDIGSVAQAAERLEAGGATNIPLGLLWGWHVLNPSGPMGAGSAEAPRNDLVKAVVLLTDGQNDLGDAGNNAYSGIGRLDQERVGVGVDATRDARRQALDSRLAALCANMKARGIVIYAIRVEVASGDDAVLKACASQPTAPYYNDVRDADQLPAVFARVGEGLIQLRLSR